MYFSSLVISNFNVCFNKINKCKDLIIVFFQGHSKEENVEDVELKRNKNPKATIQIKHMENVNFDLSKCGLLKVIPNVTESGTVSNKNKNEEYLENDLSTIARSNEPTKPGKRF